MLSQALQCFSRVLRNYLLRLGCLFLVISRWVFKRTLTSFQHWISLVCPSNTQNWSTLRKCPGFLTLSGWQNTQSRVPHCRSQSQLVDLLHREASTKSAITIWLAFHVLFRRSILAQVRTAVMWRIAWRSLCRLRLQIQACSHCWLRSPLSAFPASL